MITINTTCSEFTRHNTQTYTVAFTCDNRTSDAGRRTASAAVTRFIEQFPRRNLSPFLASDKHLFLEQVSVHVIVTDLLSKLTSFSLITNYIHLLWHICSRNYV
jgi:hypothetical protein